LTHHHKTWDAGVLLMYSIISPEQVGVGFMFLALIEPKLLWKNYKPLLPTFKVERVNKCLWKYYFWNPWIFIYRKSSKSENW